MFGSSGPKSFSTPSGSTIPTSFLPSSNGTGIGGFTSPENPFSSSSLSNRQTIDISQYNATPNNESSSSAANPFSSIPNNMTLSNMNSGFPSTTGSFQTSRFGQPPTAAFGQPSSSKPSFGSTSSRPWMSKENAKFPSSSKDSSSHAITQDSLGRYHGPNVCRMCGNQFSNADELRKHIKAESHYDIPSATGPFKSSDLSAAMAMSSSQPSATSMHAHVDSRPKPQVSFPSKFAEDNIQDRPSRGIPMNEIVSKVHKQLPRITSPPTPSMTQADNNTPTSAVSESVHDKESKLRELLRSKLLNKAKPASTSSTVSSSIESKKSPRYRPPASDPAPQTIQDDLIANDDMLRNSDPSPDPLDFDRGRRPDGRALCEDMCPVEERERRSQEYGALHDLEKTAPESAEFSMLQQTMIKRFQKSAADHDLNVPELVRTPRALLRSIIYIEENIMDLLADYEAVDPAPIVVYLFIWDRFRMIAKDFTLMNSALGVNIIWIECHERMARWYVYMDHRMKCEDDYMKAGHGQQNGESLNNIFKTLFTLYSIAEHCSDGGPLYTPNKGELVGYFIIFQIGNKGEMTKFLQQLGDDYFESEEVQFAIKVWRAIKAENYTAFFRLLRSATLLQACMMHKYVSEVRVLALSKMCRSYAVPGSVTMPCYYALSQLAELLMFEDLDEAREFVELCGFEVEDDGSEDGPCILLENQNCYNALRVDKNNNPILPVARYMWNSIESKRTIPSSNDDQDDDNQDEDGQQLVPIKDICRGYLSAEAVRFEDEACVGQTPLQISTSRPSSRPDSDGMADDSNKNGDDDYELSSQDSDDDLVAAPFPLLPSSKQSPTKRSNISPPPLSFMAARKKPTELSSSATSVSSQPGTNSNTMLSSSLKPAGKDSTRAFGLSSPLALKPSLKPASMNTSFLPSASKQEPSPRPEQPSTINTPFSIKSPVFSTPLPISTIDHTNQQQQQHQVDDNHIMEEQARAMKQQQEQREREQAQAQADAMAKAAAERARVEQERLKQEAIKREESALLQAKLAQKAEEKRLQAIEADRLKHEQEAQQALLKQQQEEEVRQARLAAIAKREEEQDRHYEQLLQQYHHQRNLRWKVQIFQAMYDHAVSSSLLTYRAELRLTWKRWCSSYNASILLRSRAYDDIRSINVAPSSCITSNLTSITRLQKKRKLIADDMIHHKEARPDHLHAYDMMIIPESTVMTLTDALKLLAAEKYSYDQQLSLDQYLPVDIPSIFGPILQQLQSLRVQRYREIDSSQYSSPSIAIKAAGSKAIWQNELFLKVAVISSCRYAGGWDIDDDTVCNMMRLLLCTHDDHEEDATSYMIGRWKDMTNCSFDGSSYHPCHRVVRASAVDICNDYDNPSYQVLGISPTNGSQIVVLTLSGHHHTSWKDMTQLRDLSNIMSKVHLIVIFSSVIASDNLITLPSFISLSRDMHDPTRSYLLQQQLQALASALNMTTTDLLAHMDGWYSITYRDGQSTMLLQQCKACLEHGFQSIAHQHYQQPSSSRLSFPLLRRFDVADWIRDAVNPRIWQPMIPSFSCQDMTTVTMNTIAEKIDECIAACEVLISDDRYCQPGFPAIDFARVGGGGVIEDEKVSGALFENLSGSSELIRIPWDWCHKMAYATKLQATINFLSSLRSVFSVNNMDELLSNLQQSHPKIVLDIAAITSNYRTFQRYLHRIIEDHVSSMDVMSIIVSIPEDVVESCDPINSVFDTVFVQAEDQHVTPSIMDVDENVDVNRISAYDDEDTMDSEMDKTFVGNSIIGYKEYTDQFHKESSEPRSNRYVDELKTFVSSEMEAANQLLNQLRNTLSNQDVVNSNSHGEERDGRLGMVVQCNSLNDFIVCLNESQRDRMASEKKLRRLLS